MKMIGIVGSRRRNEPADFMSVANAFLSVYELGDRIVSGGCPRGADRFAEVLAKEHGVPILIIYPDWKRDGRAAGLVRNGEIAREADVLIACAALDRTGGTEDTVKKFLALKVSGEKDKLNDVQTLRFA